MVVESIEIRDSELRRRCLDLFDQFQQDGQHDRLDTVITEATRILDDRLQVLSNAPAGLPGNKLAEFAFHASKARLVVSDQYAEQEAVHLLYRGSLGSFETALIIDCLGCSSPCAFCR